ncbi:MAG: hypothetical protein LV479_07600 [Methylacidiphilales bacterium]|nr:hypothetical protein [Candidatus Methylacidiphilales bacterium]
MKAIKHLVITSSLALGLAGSALANTTVIVHIVGAPAFRQPVNDAIETIVEGFAGAGLTASSAPNPLPAVGNRTTNSTIEGAKANQWLIPNFQSGIDLEINASYTGSTAGVESVASQVRSQKFIADGTGTVASPLGGESASTVVNPDVNWIANSDTFQDSTLFTGTQTFYGAARSGSPFTYTFQTLTADLGNSPGGVEVYHWVASPNAPSDFTNITTAQAKLLYTKGSLPLAFFTGNSADESTTVYALSRDPGSGARTIALAEIGVQPAGTNSPINSYVPTITSGSGVIDGEGSYVGGTITAIAQAPAGQIPSTGIYEAAGDTGYASFGTTTNGGSTADSATSSNNYGLLQAVTATPPSGAIFVTYLDNDDTNEALAAGNSYAGASAKLLTYNGVAAGTTDGADDHAVAEGEYTFWSYESFLAPSGQSSTSQAFETQLEAAFPQFSTLPFNDLNVSRTTDGGPLSPNY